MIRLVLPDAKKIGIIYTTSETNSESTIEEYKAHAAEYGFEIVEILLVPHGGWHNDTIVTVERKIE